MPVFLTLEQVVRVHQSTLERYGGLDGLRDAGLLASAVAMPQSAFDGEWLHDDLFEMAAAYLFHLAQNHPFLDGNKRVGAACALIFLAMNGVDVEADEDGLVEITLRAATGNADKRDIAAFFRSIARS
jgi:death-on-curing protein